MNDDVCLDHGERIAAIEAKLSVSNEKEQDVKIALLESKIDSLQESVSRLVGLLEPMIALYRLGKFALWFIGAALSFTHWDQLIAFFTGPHPKH